MTAPTSSQPAANVVGNFEAKYDSSNPIARRLVSGFLTAVIDLVDQHAADRVLEVGCGEGELARRILQRCRQPPRHYLATDIDISRAQREGPRALELRQASIYELPMADRSQELVICCEVLEHLAQPERALRELARVTKGAIIISTPREPLWRVLNMARGKYWSQFGNTPGHVQHFSRGELCRRVSRHFDVQRVRSPIPWTVLSATPQTGG